MQLDELTSGAVYVDPNVWYMYLRTDPAHQHTLTTFFGRVVRGAIEAFVGILVLDELFYRLLLARVKDATGRNPLEVLRTDLPGAIAAHGDAIDTALRKLMALPHVHLISVETADFHGMLNPSFRDALCNNIAKKVTEVRVAYGDSISIRFADGSTIKISLEDEDYLGGEAVNFDVGGNVLWSL